MACLADLFVVGALKHSFFAIIMVPYGTIIMKKWYRMIPFFCVKHLQTICLPGKKRTLDENNPKR